MRFKCFRVMALIGRALVALFLIADYLDFAGIKYGSFASLDSPFFFSAINTVKTLAF